MKYLKIVAPEQFTKLRSSISKEDEAVKTVVSDIVAEVINKGDKALIEYTNKFDKVDLQQLRISEADIKNSETEIDNQTKTVLNQAIVNIRTFHSRQKQVGWLQEYEDNTVLGEKVTPLDRVGVYIPGGKAFYPSTLIMNVVPAQIAEVSSIAVVSPPEQDGKPHPLILGICSLLGVSEVYAVGGAQAVAGLAYGTQTIQPVCKITGPGNVFVAEAKRQVFGQVGIDSIAGPSEIVILHDDPEIPINYLVRDLLTQAEHDEDASAILITDNVECAEKVQNKTQELIDSLPRKDIIKKALLNNSAIVTVENMNQGIDLVNQIAPEHLELMVKDKNIVNKINNAGSIFIGKWSSETIGDYYAGPNHTIPTAGAARYASPLSVRDFQKHSSIINYSKERLFREADNIASFAEMEGLYAHAAAIKIRTERDDK